VLTVGTTTDIGAGYYLSFSSPAGALLSASRAALLAHGLIYSAAILGILGAHEMGHYLACRYYNVDATLPFFLPFPLLSISGTLGAVIKIREPFPNRKVLFDIGVAGPIAGFVVLVPLLFFAFSRSTAVPGPVPEHGIFFGEPLLFKFAEWLKFGATGDNVQVNLHPIGFAAWFGMLATAWNLLPFGQLDGGHLAYATLGRPSRYMSIVTVAVSVGLCFVSISWALMTVMMVAMLYFFGPDHPRPIDDDTPIGTGRVVIAIVALVILVLCFTMVPLEIRE
jgi:membrane-associated protease RseP (regulator of RpoE activity)